MRGRRLIVGGRVRLVVRQLEALGERDIPSQALALLRKTPTKEPHCRPSNGSCRQASLLGLPRAGRVPKDDAPRPRFGIRGRGKARIAAQQHYYITTASRIPQLHSAVNRVCLTMADDPAQILGREEASDWPEMKRMVNVSGPYGQLPVLHWADSENGEEVRLPRALHPSAINGMEWTCDGVICYIPSRLWHRLQQSLFSLAAVAMQQQCAVPWQRWV